MSPTSRQPLPQFSPTQHQSGEPLQASTTTHSHEPPSNTRASPALRPSSTLPSTPFERHRPSGGVRGPAHYELNLQVLERKIECCHELLRSEPNVLAYHQIHDLLVEVVKGARALNYWTELIALRKQHILTSAATIEKDLDATWKSRIREQLGPTPFDSSHHYDRRVDKLRPVAQFIMLLVVIMRVIMGLSRTDGDFILTTLRFFISSEEVGHGGVDDVHQIPKTTETVVDYFSPDGKCVEYATCLECHCTYAPGSDGCYPAICNNKPTPETLCTASLVDEKGKPLKIFSHHLFPDYIAGLLSRPDLKHYVDDACDHFMHDRSEPSSDTWDTHSIFDATFAQDFMGPVNNKLFFDCGSEARLAFSLCVDFFQPEGTSRRGKRSSIGIISLACLNLPGDIRYKSENMFVDIIPGPKEPPLTDLNHYMRPVVDDVLDSWYNGYAISRTALSLEG